MPPTRRGITFPCVAQRESCSSTARRRSGNACTSNGRSKQTSLLVRSVKSSYCIGRNSQISHRSLPSAGRWRSQGASRRARGRACFQAYHPSRAVRHAFQRPEHEPRRSWLPSMRPRITGRAGRDRLEGLVASPSGRGRPQTGGGRFRLRHEKHPHPSQHAHPSPLPEGEGESGSRFRQRARSCVAQKSERRERINVNNIVLPLVSVSSGRRGAAT